MARNNSNNNQTLVPEAKQALRSFRDQIASEFGIDFSGYNGEKTARECGSVGGEMVKRMIEQAERSMSTTGATFTRR